MARARQAVSVSFRSFFGSIGAVGGASKRLRARPFQTNPDAARRRKLLRMTCGNAAGASAPAWPLKVSRAVLAVMPHLRALRFTILESHLALRTHALRLGGARLAGQLDVLDAAIGAKMASDGKIPHSANGGRVFHWLR